VKRHAKLPQDDVGATFMRFDGVRGQRCTEPAPAFEQGDLRVNVGESHRSVGISAATPRHRQVTA